MSGSLHRKSASYRHVAHEQVVPCQSGPRGATRGETLVSAITVAFPVLLDSLVVAGFALLFVVAGAYAFEGSDAV